VSKKKKRKKKGVLVPRLLPEAIETLGRGGPYGKTLKPKYQRPPKNERLKGEE
jgi:hypothetical protein